MRRLNAASVAALALFLSFGAALSQAQIHGTPTSVTSTGFGGHYDRVPGTRPSVTSLGPQGYTGGDHQFNPQNCCINPLFPVNPNPPRDGSNRQHHHPRPISGGIYAVPYPVYVTDPYLSDSGDEQPQPPMDYSAGPTIFDRRAPGQSSLSAEAAYAERMREVRPPDPQPPAQQAPAPEAAPEPDRPQTVLIFKDGHKLEVQNYAIIGSMLFDMTPGRRNKIAIADLDVPSTTKENDDRGITFQLPVKPVAN